MSSRSVTIIIRNDLPAIIDDKFKKRAALGVLECAVVASTEAAVMTPIDTSYLLNSQGVRQPKDTGARIESGVFYHAPYAEEVHNPDNPQNFKRPTAEKEFLKKGAEETIPQQTDILKRRLNLGA